MAVESAADLAIFFDTDDWAVASTWTPSGGSATTVNGIFDREFYESDAGGTVPVVSEQPRFTCRKSDMSTVAAGDTLNVNSTNYSIEVVEDDGQGVVFLVLSEA